MFRLCPGAAAHAGRPTRLAPRSALHAAPVRESRRARLVGPCRKIQTAASVTLAANRWHRFSDIAVTLPYAIVCEYITVMSIEQIAAEALRLSPKQRALLAESLWESLGDPFELPAEVEDEEALQLAIERDRQIESGEVAPISHDQLMARLRQ